MTQYAIKIKDLPDFILLKLARAQTDYMYLYIYLFIYLHKFKLFTQKILVFFP